MARGVMQLLVAILHLGNVGFGSGDEAAVDDDVSWASLEAACALLQADPAKVRDGMCLRRMKAGSEWVTTGNTGSQASDVRHALAKQVSERRGHHPAPPCRRHHTHPARVRAWRG